MDTENRNSSRTLFLPVFKRPMKPRGTSSWGNCRRKKKKWGKCLFRESRRRRLNSKRQRKRYRPSPSLRREVPDHSRRDIILSFFSPCSYMRNLTVWKSFTRTRKRSWRRRGSRSTTSSTCSNRKGLPQSSCKTKHSKQGAPPRSRGTRRGKSKYCSLPTVPPNHLF